MVYISITDSSCINHTTLFIVDPTWSALIFICNHFVAVKELLFVTNGDITEEVRVVSD